ncbi:hypothetical protein F5878DRAFT_647337 [Lentinula raphanica]|uniref:Uncharacterized protein n=1 Tax=Lentinula raphanica TaxID=153919 RepID=A0AA38NW44_9AGAR|nr:hypothetical protein F5878DRAFT_647387 [Lentinula raphanica]KAJ3831796.1 hypothetical protein F5878DRAFT_647337 [Lentinula raphanica]
MNMTRHHSSASQYNKQPTRPGSSQRPELPPLSIPSTPLLSNGFSSSPPSSPALISWVASSKTSLSAADSYGDNECNNEEYGFDRDANNWNHTSSEARADGQRSTLNERSVRQPDLPKHLSNGGFIRSHPTDENHKYEYYMHGSRFDSRRNSSMQPKPDSVSSANQNSPKSRSPRSPTKQRECVSTTTTSPHSASFELGRASDPRDPSRGDTAQRTTRPDGIQAIDQLSPSVDPDTTRTAVPPKRLRRVCRVLTTLAKLLQKQ